MSQNVDVREEMGLALIVAGDLASGLFSPRRDNVFLFIYFLNLRLHNTVNKGSPIPETELEGTFLFSAKL